MPEDKSGFSEEDLKNAGFGPSGAAQPGNEFTPSKEGIKEVPPPSPEPASIPSEMKEEKTRFHHVGGPSGGKDLTDAQYAEYMSKSEQVHNMIGNRQLGDLSPNDPYWEAKKELDKFLSSL